ncbi:PKD domain-containing protein [Chitinophaga lutea]
MEYRITSLRGAIYRIILCLALLVACLPAIAQQAGFTADVQSGCAPLTVNFSNTSDAGALSYDWDFEPGASHATSRNASRVFSKPGNYNVVLTVNYPSGPKTFTQTITVHENPTAAFTITGATGCTPHAVQFASQSTAGSGTIKSMSWDFGDGNTSTDASPSHTYNISGIFSASLIIVNSFNCTNVATQNDAIRIEETPKADFAADRTGSCTTPLPVQFYAFVPGATNLTFQWDFGDGATSTEGDPAHTYQQEGRYTVTLTARSQAGCETVVTKRDYIIIEKTRADFGVNGPACAGTSVVLQNRTTPSPTFSNWTLPGNSQSVAHSPSVFFPAPGDYDITLTSGLPGCMETVTKTITVHPKPAVDFTASPTSGCAVPFNTTFSANAPAAASWAWTFGDNGVSDQASPSHTYQAFGNYNVELTVTSAEGCESTITKPRYISLQQPVLNVWASEAGGCIPFTPTFQSLLTSGGTIASYEWNFGDNSPVSTAARPSHTFTQQGIFTVRLVATLANGCQVEQSITVEAGEIPVVDFEADRLAPCQSERVTFTNKSMPVEPGTRWLWTFLNDNSNATEQHPEHLFQRVGKHSVQLQVNNYGCIRQLIKTDYIDIHPPAARFTVPPFCTTPYTVQFVDESDFGPDGDTRPKSWQWDFGDNTTSTDQSPQHTYAQTGEYLVKLTVSNGNCESYYQLFVRIIDEKPVLHADKTEICAGAPVHITRDPLNANNIRRYQWIWSDGSTVTPASLDAFDKRFNNAGQYEGWLVITDENNCNISSNHLQFKVNSPRATFSSTGSCRGEELSFTDNSAPSTGYNITSWTWDFGDASPVQTFTTAPASTKHTYAAAGTVNVRLTVQDDFGCSSTASRLLQVNDVNADFTAGGGTIACLNQDKLFIDRSSGVALQYAWDFGDGQTSAARSPLIRYTAGGKYTVSLKVRSPEGCVSDVTKTEYIHVPDPKAVLKVQSNQAICPPAQVQFGNESTGFLRSAWTFGDGGRSTLEAPFHVYNRPGKYNVLLEVYAEGDCMSSATEEIEVKGPTGTYTTSATVGCVPHSVTFNAVSNNAVKFTWDMDNGTVATSSATTHTYLYDQSGVFSPRVILEDANGCKFPAEGPPDGDIVVDEAKAAFSLDDSRACDAGEVFFRNASTSLSNTRFNAPMSFRWDFGYPARTDDVAADEHPTFFYEGVGTYTATLEVTTVNGCTHSTTLPVNVEPKPDALIRPINPVCAGDSIRLSGVDNKGLPGTRWTWTVDGQPYTGTAPAPRLAFQQPGRHTVQLVIRNNNNKCPDESLLDIDINPLPNLQVTPRTAAICLGESLQLQSNAGNAQLSWTNYRISNASAINPSIQPDRDTIYRVTALNQFGCIRRDSMRVAVSQPFTVSASDVVMCNSRQTQLHASGAVRYQWLPATGLQRADVADPLARPAQTTRYQVVGFGQDACFTDTAEVLVTVNPSPQLTVPGETIVPAGSSQPLTVRGSDDIVQWQWYPAQWLNCADCPAPVTTPKGDITYNITATNAHGCQTVAMLPVKLACPGSTAFIPNSFSPNGDGQNDIFYVRGRGIAQVKSFRIFNRWGQLVFERGQCRTDDPGCGWDGKFNGQPLQPDVYIYFAELVCDTNEPMQMRGNVTLLR